ncbi:hypothetical protein [Pseudooceanicola nanhaiensis]|uniref:hypothetical protein n=1 Tax=Pseudooceanicola nanhaiensis TaxID=375761 RepID=UPI00405859B3
MRTIYYSFLVLMVPNIALAIPDFWKTVGFDTPTDVVVYADHEDPNKFYVMPNTIYFVKDGKNTLFGMSHWGVTAKDDDGVGGSVTFTATAGFENKEFVEGAWADFRKNNPQAKLLLVPGEEWFVEFLLAEDFVSSRDPTAIAERAKAQADPDKPVEIVISGSDPSETEIVSSEGAEFTFARSAQAVDAFPAAQPGVPFAFTTSLSRLGARQIAYANDDFEEVDRPLAMVVRYQMKYTGLGPRYKIRISVDFNRVYTYFQTASSSSRWFGLRKASNVQITKDLQSNGAVTYEILEGALSPEDKEVAAAQELYTLLTNARVNGTGLFKPAFEPSLVGGGAGNAGGWLGWGRSSKSFSEVLSQNTTAEFIIERKETSTRVHSMGISLGEFCEESPELFVNLSESSPRCIDVAEIEKIDKVKSDCNVKNADALETLANRLVAGEIDTEEREKIVGVLLEQCIASAAAY